MESILSVLLTIILTEYSVICIDNSNINNENTQTISKYSDNIESCEDCKNRSVNDPGKPNAYCYNGQCICAANYLFDYKLKSCVYFSCNKDIECQTYDMNRVCDTNDTNKQYPRCVCRTGYQPDFWGTGICVNNKHGLLCKSHADCMNSELVCWDGVCKCSPNYDDRSGKCSHNGCQFLNLCQQCMARKYCRYIHDDCHCSDDLHEFGTKCSRCSEKDPFNMYDYFHSISATDLVILLIVSILVVMCMGVACRVKMAMLGCRNCGNDRQVDDL